jgi:hypothetical protein
MAQLGGKPTILDCPSDGIFAPIPDLPAVAPEWGSSILCGHSPRQMKQGTCNAPIFQNWALWGLRREGGDPKQDNI